MNPLNTLKKFFLSPIILGVIVLVCVYAYFSSEEKERKIANGFSAEVCADSTQIVVSTLRDILKDEDPDKYLQLAKGFTDRVEFPGRLIPNRTFVRVIDTLESHPEIVQIYIHRENPTTVNPSNEYLWIWEGYVCKD